MRSLNLLTLLIFLSANGCTSRQDLGDRNSAGAGGLAGERGSSINDPVGETDNASPQGGQANGGHAGSSPITEGGAPSIPDGALRVFVTSSHYTGLLGGLEGADELCNAAAESAELGGKWVAWLSDSPIRAEVNDARDRVTGDGPWYRLDAQLAFKNGAQLLSSPLVPINVDEFGHSGCDKVWTGTATGGRAKSIAHFEHCDHWLTSASNSFDISRNLYENNAIAGSCESTTQWTDLATNYNCAWEGSLYCFEVR